jgi:hypothetical protein
MIEIIKQIKGVFKLPERKWDIGKIQPYPYFMPYGHIPTIFSFRQHRGCKSFKLFNKIIYYGTPILYKVTRLGWKDKWDSPRFEWPPAKHLYIFYWQIGCVWMPPKLTINSHYPDLYWEMILWYLNYSNKDIKEAEKTWSWINVETKKSTWNNNYILNK